LPKIGVRLNSTLSAEAMQILQEYREGYHRSNGGAMTPDVYRLVSFLFRSAQDVPQNRPVLRAEVADMIRAIHRADAEFISSRYGVDLGLQEHSPVPPPPLQQSYRVQDIVSTVDPDSVHRLLLNLANTELSRPPARRPLPLRIARRVYRAIPPDRRPERLAARFRAPE
jgi:hypothetical protein